MTKHGKRSEGEESQNRATLARLPPGTSPRFEKSFFESGIAMKKLTFGHPYGSETVQNIKAGIKTRIPNDENTQTSPMFFNRIKFGQVEFIQSWWTLSKPTNGTFIHNKWQLVQKYR